MKEKNKKPGKDIHCKTAAELFNKNIKEISGEERSIAKTINFGILYSPKIKVWITKG